MSNGSFTGGINGSGTFESVAGTTDTLNNVTIYNGTTFTVSSGATTNIFGTISDRGTIVIDGTSSNAIVNLGSNVTLSGGGAVTLKSDGGSAAYLRGNGVTLTNANDTIQGAGNVGDSGALGIANQATIDANASGQNLNVNGGNGGVTNTGTLEATGGGTLLLFNKITNTGGAITASGTGSVVDIDNATVIGGTLNTASGGLLRTVGSADLNGVTISAGSTYTTAGATTQLDTSLTNDGTFLIDGSASNAIVNLGSNVTLSGGGAVTMKSGGGTAAFFRGSGVTLTNANDTIQGAGNIGDSGALGIANQATIDANGSGQNLNLSQGGGVVTNTGTLEATAGGVLQIFSKVTNTGGAITANGGTVNVIGTISGGTLNTLNGGVMETSGGGANLSGVTISKGSTYTAGTGSTTQLNGAIVDAGTLAINGASGNAIVNLGSAVTLSGGGQVIMSSGTSGSAFLRGSKSR